MEKTGLEIQSVLVYKKNMVVEQAKVKTKKYGEIWIAGLYLDGQQKPIAFAESDTKEKALSKLDRKLD